ncbi:MAG: DUF350 domain-containing protein [Bryobacteraceae bacterium]|nr:DUF350 domain-containing protein [Bryobacteraceae bacterium]
MTGFHFEAFINAIVYAILGIVIFAISFITIDKLTPHDLWKEIIEEKNIALAIIVGFMALAMGIIIAAAVH